MRMLAILDDQAVIIHGHSVKGIERVVRCYENANEVRRSSNEFHCGGCQKSINNRAAINNTLHVHSNLLNKSNTK